MSWFGLFKKVRKEEANKILEKEKISFEQLPQKLKERENETLERIKQLKKEIQERIFLLERDLQEPITSLEHLNLDKIKEHEKIKIVVKENLYLYIFLLKKLIMRLKENSEEHIKEYFEKVSFILNEFNASSHLPFEKSTLLIGEEMRAPTEAVRAFIKYFREFAARNQEMIEEIEKIRSIEKLLCEFEEKITYVESLSILHKKLNEEVQRKREKIEVTRKHIASIICSDECRKERTIKESHEREIENEISLLRKKINFKLLAQCFHHDDKRNILLKKYTANFKSALLEDELLQILEMIRVAQNLDLEELGKIRARLLVVPEPFFSKSEKEIFLLEEICRTTEIEISSTLQHIQEELMKKEKILLKIKKLESEVTSSAEHLFPKLEILSQSKILEK